MLPCPVRGIRERRWGPTTVHAVDTISNARRHNNVKELKPKTWSKIVLLNLIKKQNYQEIFKHK